jgi:hypothetical protein
MRVSGHVAGQKGKAALSILRAVGGFWHGSDKGRSFYHIYLKQAIMKQYLVAAAASLALLGTACKQKTQEAQVLGAYRDSAELAAFNQWKLQKAIDSARAVDSVRDAEVERLAAAKVAEREAEAARTRPAETRTVYVRDRSNYRSGYRSSGSRNYNSAYSQPAATQNRRQGWSKAAKGAVIGAAGGAVVGAVVTNKNKGVGAAIGAVAGGATGYAIGRGEDRKDGRVQPRQ